MIEKFHLVWVAYNSGVISDVMRSTCCVLRGSCLDIGCATGIIRQSRNEITRSAPYSTTGFWPSITLYATRAILCAALLQPGIQLLLCFLLYKVEGLLWGFLAQASLFPLSTHE